MTPLIDIIFLLIIFFLMVYRFIDVENFPVNLPAECSFASTLPPKITPVNLTVMHTPGEKTSYAVGSVIIQSKKKENAIKSMTDLINQSLKSTTRHQQIVRLRIDKKTPFKLAKPALDAVAKSRATKIQLGTLKKQN